MLDTVNYDRHLVFLNVNTILIKLCFFFQTPKQLCFLTDFECILDKNKKPLSYMAQNILLGALEGIHWRCDIKVEERKALPPGAQRLVPGIII